MSKILKTALTVLLSIVCLFGMVSCGKEETPPTSSTPSKPSGPGTVPVYRIEYVADGVSVGLGEYIHAGSIIVEPEVPAKKGYMGRWEEYSLSNDEHITVNAIYDPITYSITYHTVKISGDNITVDSKGAFDEYWGTFPIVQRLNLPTSYTVESDAKIKRMPEVETFNNGEVFVSTEFSKDWYTNEHCTEVFSGTFKDYAEDLDLYTKEIAVWFGA